LVRKRARNIHWYYLSGKVATEFELLQSDSHRVGPEEQNEGHESKIWNILAGFSYQ